MISKIQNFKYLKGGLNKHWPIKKDISYDFQCRCNAKNLGTQ